MATTTTTKEPAKQLSPAELFEELMERTRHLADGEERDAARKAEEELAKARSRLDRLAQKRLRIMRAASVEEADAILAESEVDANLKTLCAKLSGWKALQEKGATDEQLKALLGKWPTYRDGNGVPAASSNYNRKSPMAFVDPDDAGKALTGQALLAAVRRVMGVGKPVAPKPEAKKPAKAPAAKSKAKAAAAAPAKADPADAGAGDDDDEAGGAEAKAAPAARSGGVKHRPQTWGQWAATLRGINGRIDLDPNLPDKAAPDERERFFLDQFARKRRPADARDAWQKVRPPDGPLPSVAALELPQTPMPTPGNEAPARLEPRSYQDPAEVGVTPAELEVSMNARALGPPSPGERAPLASTVKPIRLRDGHCYAAIRARHYNAHNPFRRVVEYTLRRLYRPDEWQGVQCLTWNGLPGAGKLAPEDVRLGGLVVDDAGDPDGPPWILGDEADQLHVDVIGQPVARVVETKELGPADKPKEVTAARAAHDAVIKAGGTFDQAVNAGAAAMLKAAEEEEADDGDPDPPPAVRAEHDAIDAAWQDDPNVDGRGVFVSGVEELWAWKNPKGEVRILLAQGADGLWRTGHRVEFVGQDVWQADTEEPVRWSAQATESEAYAVRARANILLNRLRGGDGAGASSKWTAKQKSTYGAAINALEAFVAGPACRSEPRATAKAG